ncbi:MAG: phage portal protein [Cyanobacteria bacterium J06648_11]
MADDITILNLDSNALTNSLSVLQNRQTGYGTWRDKSEQFEVNLNVRQLTYSELEALYDGHYLIAKAVDMLPEAAGRYWLQWTAENDERIPERTEQYVKKLKLRSHFVRAGQLGRLYGDGFLILGINDGRKQYEPVDEENIKGITFVRAVSPYTLRPDTLADVQDPQQYWLGRAYVKFPDEFEEDARDRSTIHASRVLRIPGRKLFEANLYRRGGYNQSMIQLMYGEFVRYLQGIMGSSSMLSDWNVFKYKMKGLASAIDCGNTEGLLNRFLAVQMGMSTIKGLILDADDEDAEFITRNFSGANDIVRELRDNVIGASGIPRSKLLGSADGSAFSSQDKGDRYQWADTVEVYEENFWRPELEKVQRYIYLAQDGPTSGKLPEQFDFTFNKALQLTREEEAKLRNMHATADKTHVEIKALHPMEVRGRYRGSQYSDDINLDEQYDEELAQGDDEPPKSQQEQPALSDRDRQILDELAELDFGEDAIAADRFSPEYWEWRDDSDDMGFLADDIDQTATPLQLDSIALQLDAIFLDKAKHTRAKAEAKKQSKIWPSAYGSMLVVRLYKKMGGRFAPGNEDDSDVTEDGLKEWLSENWRAINSSGEDVGPCGSRPKGKLRGKQKCLPASEVKKRSRSQLAAAARRKQRQDPNPDREGRAINVRTDSQH